MMELVDSQQAGQGEPQSGIVETYGYVCCNATV